MTMYRFAKLIKERNTELTDLVHKDSASVVLLLAIEAFKRRWLTVIGISSSAFLVFCLGLILSGKGYTDDTSFCLIMATTLLIGTTMGVGILKYGKATHSSSGMDLLKKLTLLEKALGRKIGLPAWEDKKYAEAVVKYLRARALQISILQDEENRYPWEEKKSVMLRSAWETEVHTLSDMIEGVPHHASVYF